MLTGIISFISIGGPGPVTYLIAICASSIKSLKNANKSRALELQLNRGGGEGGREKKKRKYNNAWAYNGDKIFELK